MPNLKYAKRSAAFKACKLLYAFGELSENLMPMTVKRQFNSLNEVYFKHYENFREGTFPCENVLFFD